jgi:hypothetical protein
MLIEDIPKDPRWTDRERLMLNHMLRDFNRYKGDQRKDNAYGLGKGIWVMWTIMDATSPPLQSIPPDPFRTLL